MKFITCCLFCLAAILCEAQILADFPITFKEAPVYTHLCESIDGKYFMYGDIVNYGDEFVADLIKVDGTGARVPGFKTVQTDALVRQVVPLPSGQLLMSGDFRYINGIRRPNVVRLNADGSVDESFALANNPSVVAMVVQTDGKVVATSGSTWATNLIRYKADGSIDPSFNFSLEEEDATIEGLYLDLAGHVFVGITRWAGTNSLVKLKTNGDVDESFHYEWSYQGLPIGTIVFQADGRLVFSASHAEFGSQYEHLMRVNADGSKDDTFHEALANGIVLETGGRKNGNLILSIGWVGIDNNWCSVAELDKDGNFIRSVISDSFRNVNSISEDSGGNLLLTGYFEKIDALPIAYSVKVKPDNTVDASFKLPVSSVREYPIGMQMAAQSTGKLLVPSTRWGFQRLNPDGTVDHTFEAALALSGDFPLVEALAVQDDDKIIVGGQTIFSNPLSLGRLNADGSFDATFQIGKGPQNSDNSAWVKKVIIKSGKIYVIGYFETFDDHPSPGLAILDGNGKWIGPVENWHPTYSQNYDMGVQSDGKIILLPPGTSPMVRLNADGSKDDSFVSTDVPFGFNIDAQDRILMYGWFMDTRRRKGLIRLDKNGVLDEGFASTDLNADFGSFNFVEPLPDNLIAVGGSFNGYNNMSSPAVMILDDDGSPVAMNNPLDSALSTATAAVYHNKALYMFGRFSSGHGMNVTAGAKIVFSDTTLGRFVVKAQTDEATKLTWRNNVENATGTRIERSTPDDAHFEVIDELAPNVTSYTAKDLQELTPYYFRITGYNASYASSFVGHDSTLIAPQPSMPATKVTDDSFTANWKAIPLTDSVLLQVSSDNFITYLPGYEKRIVKGTNSNTVTGLAVGQQYTYRVKRFRNGKSSGFSEVVAINIVLAAEENVLSHLQVYPNPARTQLTITLPENTRHASANVHSLQGTRMANYTLNSGTSQLDVQALPAGVYILAIAVDGASKNVKFVKVQ
ncbi:MAG TPA: T9SS type A sorting domain-containing protein [Chryseolinea sp.]